MKEVINTVGMGINDPHIHIFNNKAYLYASHDYSSENTRFVMKDWQVWSSEDLLSWQWESTLKPEETYIGKPIDGCWATDAVEKNGKYYWAFSEVDRDKKEPRIGMVESDSPTGPWVDFLMKPFLDENAADTEVYDPCFFKDDDGSVHILFGAFDYYMAPLSEDMHALADKPKKVTIINPQGPYGKGKTDDKVSLHKRKGLYYLSWGSYYAVSSTLDGPYTYRGCIVDPAKMEKRFRDNTWPHGPTQGRHGNFFEWKDQWYFTYCEMCFSGNRYFRDFWISPVNYLENGDMETIRINSKAINA
jgi:arabinoxylan arabinofuranohydrolase